MKDVNFPRDRIFNELRDVIEREKRKYSIILRGLDYNSVNVCDKFKDVCQIFNISSVDLSDVKISDKKLFRAKMLNDYKRRILLMVTGRLRTMDGSENVYIQKDLTYRQRQELSERRRKSRLSTVGEGANSHQFFPALVKPRPAISGSTTGSSADSKHGGQRTRYYY